MDSANAKTVSTVTPIPQRIAAELGVRERQVVAAVDLLDGGVADPAAALGGARAILIERFAEDADLVGVLRERMWSRGWLVSRVREGRQDAGAKFADYFDVAEPFTALPSHRILAMLRGEKEEILVLSWEPDRPGGSAEPGDYEQRVAAHAGIADRGRPADGWLLETARLAWRTRILIRPSVDPPLRLPQPAQHAAGRVCAGHPRDLPPDAPP